MPQIIPIKDLKNTSEVSELCHSTSEPIFITKNGYGDMVLMSMETFERTTALSGCTKIWMYPNRILRRDGPGMQKDILLP